jgi:hypothetical protein
MVCGEPDEEPGLDDLTSASLAFAPSTSAREHGLEAKLLSIARRATQFGPGSPLVRVETFISSIAQCLGAGFGYGPKRKLSETETPKLQNQISPDTPVYPS